MDFSLIKTGDIGIESNNTYFWKKIKRLTWSIATHVVVFLWLWSRESKELFISEYLEWRGHRITKASERIKEWNLIAIRRSETAEDYMWGVATGAFWGKYDMRENFLIYLKLRMWWFLNFFWIKIKEFDDPFKHNCSWYAALVNWLDQTRFWTPGDLLHTKKLKTIWGKEI